MWVRPFGPAAGFSDDHLHVDLGFTSFIPRHAPGA
jgi:hypothetical protein